ncbi:MAG: CoA transferase, partial [Bryobacteraceae bacterium]
ALGSAIDRPDLLSKVRLSGPERAKAVEEVAAIVGEWTAARDKHEVMRTLGAAGIPCGAVLDTTELLDDPHLRERGMIAKIEHPVRGALEIPGCPVRLDDSPAEISAAPLLGQHNAEVYGDLLGLSAAQLEALKNEGVI